MIKADGYPQLADLELIHQDKFIDSDHFQEQWESSSSRNRRGAIALDPNIHFGRPSPPEGQEQQDEGENGAYDDAFIGSNLNEVD